MNSKTLVAALIAVPALVALKPLADSVLFQPEDGSSASKEYSINAAFSLGDFSAMVDGADMSEGVPGDFEMTGEILMSVTDQYVSSLSGRPVELIRTFDSLSMTWETPDDSGEDEDIGDLEGKSVLFKWNAEDEDYDKAFHECEGDEDDLEDLTPEIDIQALLPDGDVSEGDTWTLESSDLSTLMVFGSDMSEIDMSDLGDGDEIEELFSTEINPQLTELIDTFEAQCEYTGTRDLDGKTLGVIAVTLRGEGDVDLTGVISGLAESQIPAEVEIELSIDEAAITIVLEGEGELLWDIEAGLFHSYDLTAEVELLADVALSVNAQGEDHDLEASAEVLGEMIWSASVN